MADFVLTEENYYSPEADWEYMSVSQYKTFAGTWGMKGCEAKALALLKGEWENKTTDAMLIGSYVDAAFEGTLDKFKAEHPELYTQKGELYAKYQHADEIVARAKKDKLFNSFMSGEKQVIMTGNIFGCKWKIKMDSYAPGKFITDLKCVRQVYEEDITEEPNAPKKMWVKDTGYMDWMRFWGYDIQGAIYQEIVRQNTGKQLPFFIAAVDKQEEPAIGIFMLDNQVLREAFLRVQVDMPRILDLKANMGKPDRCEFCDYCKRTKVLTDIIRIHPGFEKKK